MIRACVLLGALSFQLSFAVFGQTFPSVTAACLVPGPGLGLLTVRRACGAWARSLPKPRGLG